MGTKRQGLGSQYGVPLPNQTQYCCLGSRRAEQPVLRPPATTAHLLREAGRRRTSLDTGSRYEEQQCFPRSLPRSGSLQSGVSGLPCFWPPCFESPPTHQPVYPAFGYKPIIAPIIFPFGPLPTPANKQYVSVWKTNSICLSLSKLSHLFWF